MIGRHRSEDDVRTTPRASRGARRRWRVPALLASAALTGTVLTVGLVAPTSAAAADHSATISLTGVTSQTYPTGGNTVWVQPGSTLTLTEAPLSSGANQGLLGVVSGVLNGLLGASTQLVDLRAEVDLSSVQRGHVTLGGGGQAQVVTPGLAKGVYPFTWSFTAVAVVKGLLGSSTKTIALNANQLGGLGLKVNASNQYVGYIVSDTKSPCPGAQCISLQTPTLSVAPSAPVVGQLPTVTVPGTTVNVPVPGVPGVNTSASGAPGGPASGAPGSSAPGAAPAPGAASSGPTNPYGYTAPGCTGPCLVVPRGGGGGGTVGGAYGVTLGDLSGSSAGSGGGAAGGGAAATAPGAVQLAGGADGLAVDRAFSADTPRGITATSLPTGLAVAAVAALAGATVLWLARRRFARR